MATVCSDCGWPIKTARKRKTLRASRAKCRLCILKRRLVNLLDERRALEERHRLSRVAAGDQT